MISVPKTLSIEKALQRVFYFRLLSPEQLAAMERIASVKSYQMSEMIFHEGESAESFYIVIEGRVQIYKISREGKEMILHLFGPGEIFAEVPIFSGIPIYPANAICMQDTQVLCIDGKAFRELVTTYPTVGMSMLSVFAKRLHEFSVLIEDLSLRSVDARLAKYLLSVSDNTKKADIHIQKKTLASILGTIPETLSRSFKKLSQEQLIQIKGSDIHLLDIQALAKLADM